MEVDMKHVFIVSEHLAKLGLYPIESDEEDGLFISLIEDVEDSIVLSGSPNDLIELADYLVSLALSGEDTGQHWHIDTPTLVSPQSEIPEIIATRNGFRRTE